MKINEVLKPSTVSVATFLETAPRDELYTAEELASKFELSASTVRHSRVLSKYKLAHGDNWYYGSKLAREEFLKMKGLNESI